jgi:spoIIIJ-associated protein
MTNRVEARAESLVDALEDLLRAIGDEGVTVRLDVEGFDLDTIGPVRLVLEVETEDEDGPVDASEDEEGEDEEGEDEADEDVARDVDDEDVAGDDEDDGDEDEDDEEDEYEGPSIEELDEEAEAAADFLEGLLDAMGLPGDIQIRVHEDRAEVEVVNLGSGQLIGRRGQTLDAVQELLRCAMQRRFERRCRVVVDMEGYRQRRLDKFLEKAEAAVEEVLDTGDEQRLEPMDVYERKAVHRLVAEHDGVTSASRGREPTRRVVITRE